jgi:alkylation response protein AidB-like acyl-CoA dehydrogenase
MIDFEIPTEVGALGEKVDEHGLAPELRAAAKEVGVFALQLPRELGGHDPSI